MDQWVFQEALKRHEKGIKEAFHVWILETQPYGPVQTFAKANQLNPSLTEVWARVLLRPCHVELMSRGRNINVSSVKNVRTWQCFKLLSSAIIYSHKHSRHFSTNTLHFSQVLISRLIKLFNFFIMPIWKNISIMVKFTEKI